MKILQVISYFYPAWSYGGPGKLVYEISANLSSYENVTVYSTDAFDSKRRRNKNDNILIPKRIKTNFFANINNYLAYRLKFFLPPFLLNKALKEVKKFDVIHFHEFFTGTVVILSDIAFFFKVPYVISAHGTLHSFHLKNRSFLKRIFFIIFGNKIIKNASGFIAATKKEIIDYQNLGIPKHKICYIPNGIDTKLFKKLPRRGIFRNQLNIAKDAMILLYLGRINRLKGLDLLIKAFSQIQEKEEIYLVIAGSDDGYMSVLKGLVKKQNLEKRIFFPGVLDSDLKLKVYSDTDFFIYPSPSEGFSLAILEAGAASLPLLITEGCNFPEVENSNSGIIVKFSLNGIKNGLMKILENKDNLQSMGKNAHSLVTRQYSIEKMVRNLLNNYEKLK